MSDRDQPYEGYQPPAYTGYTGQDAPQAPADPYAVPGTGQGSASPGYGTGPTPPQAPAYTTTPYPAPGYGAPGYPTEPPGRTLGIVGFILAFVMPVAGIVVSAMSLSASRRAQVPNPLGTWGLWLSIIFTVAAALIFLAYVGLFFATAGLAVTSY